MEDQSSSSKSNVSCESKFCFCSLCFVLGFCLPLAGVVGGEYLIFLAFIAALYRPRSIRPRDIMWALPFVLLQFFWVISYAAYEAWHLGAGSIGELLVRDRAHLNALALSFAKTLNAVGVLLWTIVVPLLFSMFKNSSASRSGFVRGLQYGLGLALVLTTANVLGYYHPPTESAHWNSLTRFPGSFSDPNAFGIFVVLVLPLLFYGINGSAVRGSILQRVYVLVWVLISLFSGSRTLFLGLAALFVCVLWRKRPIYVHVTLVCAGLFVIGVNFYTPDSASLSMPSAVNRVLASLQYSNLQQTIFSRRVFNTVGLALVSDNPVLGAGLGSFRSEFPAYAAALGFELNGWTDNSNNYYLGILSELGIAGLISWLIGISCFRFNPHSFLYSRIVLVLLLGLLFIGPHLDFAEISILTAFYMGLGLETRPLARPVYAFLLMLAPLVALRAGFLSYGLYASEKGGASRIQWTMKRSSFVVPCESIGNLKAQAYSPEISRRPLILNITAGPNRAQIEFTGPGWKEIPIDCEGSFALDRFGVRRQWQKVSLESNYTWSPCKVTGVSDCRVLGLQLEELGLR